MVIRQNSFKQTVFHIAYKFRYSRIDHLDNDKVQGERIQR